MPMYRFKCVKCEIFWEETQSVDLNCDTQTAHCPDCGEKCNNIAFGGSGFQFAGRMCNKQLTDFPDYANKINKCAEEDAEEMERNHDAYMKERLRKEKDAE